MFEGFSLPLDAHFHLFAQLLINLEVLNLKSIVPLLLRVCNLSRHLLIQAKHGAASSEEAAIEVARVRNAVVELALGALRLMPRTGSVWQLLSCLRNDGGIVVAERGARHVSRVFLISVIKLTLNSDFAHLTLLD